MLVMNFRRSMDMNATVGMLGCRTWSDHIYTPTGYYNWMDDMAANADAKINRLNRIAGQVNGVAKMIEDDRYCMDILHQIQAIKSALAKVETQVLKDHAACCVAEAIASGNEAEQREKFEELVELLEKRR